MSIPRDILDQLLSGYLDDVLSDDERTRLEQLLQDDGEVASELEDLRRIRGSLRQISRADAHVRLDDGFADRVLGAAVAQATTEGLGEDHPLIKVAEHPSTPQLAKTIPIAKIAGGLVALAASIAIAIVTFQPAKTPLGLNGPELAAVDQSTVSTTPENIVDSATDILKKDVSPDELIAAAEPNIEVKDPVIATGIAKSVSPNPMPEVDSPSAESIASVASAPVPAPSMIDKASKMPTEAEAAALLGESNVLTILVKRTEAGRQSRAVRNALRGASIDPAQEKALTEGMVNAVSESLSKDDAATASRTQILYLEVPAKKVDVFFARLLADEEGIESIRLGMVATPSVRRLVQTLS
ncbi:MAG: hypothetical protein WBD20_07375, partial [Pirellulaceae bacterium]